MEISCWNQTGAFIVVSNDDDEARAESALQELSRLPTTKANAGKSVAQNTKNNKRVDECVMVG